MKKFALFFVLVISFTIALGQKNVRQSASNYLKDGKLDKALEAINQCVLDASTAQDAKAWFIRGSVYLAIYDTKDEKFKNLDTDPLSKALESYKKSLELDPQKEIQKKEYYNDIVLKVDAQYKIFFDSAVAKYNKKSYKEAMISFGKAADVAEIINIDTLCLLNGALCAGYAKEKEAEKEFYLRLLKGNYKSPNVYSTLSYIYLEANDSANAFKYIRLGMKDYPNDQNLLTNEINIYLRYNVVDKAMSNLKNAMLKDTANYSLPHALGTLYDNIANDTSKSISQREEAFRSAEKSYETALKIKPDFYDAIFNLGAINLNKAYEIISKSNNLPLDSVEANIRAKRAAEVYLSKAASYFERAIVIQPTDPNAQNALRQIYSQLVQTYTLLGLPDKKAIVLEKLNNLKKK